MDERSTMHRLLLQRLTYLIGKQMAAVGGSTRQKIVAIGTSIQQRRMIDATTLLEDLVYTLPYQELVLVQPELTQLISLLFPKRRREMTVMLDDRLARGDSGKSTLPIGGLRKDDTREDRVNDYAQHLAELRDRHIFQWGTYYRETVGYIFKDLVSSLRNSDECHSDLGAVGQAFALHSSDIFSRGYQRLDERGISFDIAEIKSISGLQRFLYLIIGLFIDQRDGIHKSKDARIAWDIASSILIGILRGYGRTEFGSIGGWALLRRNIRAWLPVLGFTRGSDTLSFLEEFPSNECIDDVYVTVVPALLGVERLANRFHGQEFVLPRLSRVTNRDPASLQITFSVAGGAATRDLILFCYFQDDVDDPASLNDAIALHATVVVACIGEKTKPWIETDSSGRIIDASEVRATSEQVQNLSDLICARLEKQSIADAASLGPGLLSRNYAREFPLEDPDFRRLFIVERYTVKRLLEQIEGETGVNLWCSVRRSGKTTATSSFSYSNGRSVVVLQTMDHQTTQIEQNLLERRVREALDNQKAIPTDFFQKIVDECVLSTTPVDLERRKIVLIIDEYESLFGLINAYLDFCPGLRFLVAQPLLSQMVGFASKNLLILMGQRPDAHLILSSQNQLSPLVKQNNFPLFEHIRGSTSTEFSQFLRRVLTEKLPYSAGFADAVYEETGGHPYLTVNLMVDFCDWLIANHAKEGDGGLDASHFTAFSRERLTQAALQRSPHYPFFHGMLTEYLSEQGRLNEPWLFAITSVLREIARKHPRAFSCSIANFQQLASPYAHVARMTPERLLASAAMSNFLKDRQGQVSPGIRLMARLAASAIPQVN